MAWLVRTMSHPRDTVALYFGTGIVRFTALTVGLFSNVAEGEYSKRMRLGLSTSNRAAPDRTIAEGCAWPLAMSIGVERFTGEVSVCAAADACDAVATSTITTTPSINTEARTNDGRMPKRFSPAGWLNRG